MKTSAVPLFALSVATACGRLSFDPLIDAVFAVADSSSPAGCADGTREAFTDLVAFPTIAGCAATWNGLADLRAPATGSVCGNDGASCIRAADACATGWHICGDAGDPSELASRVTAAQCGAVVGAFAVAMQHCSMRVPCGYTTPYGCVATVQDCAEPVCCGTQCATGNACKDGVFVGATTVAGLIANGSGNTCGALDSSHATGVLCCR
jgi:hypothetical protein